MFLAAAVMAALIVPFALTVDAQRLPPGGVPIPQPGQGGNGLPPGFPGGGGAKPQGSGADLYNLGPIGGKAAMTTAPKPGLEVKELVEKAPGETGGLKQGDLIVGAPNAFKSDAYHELGAAIELAEQAKKDKDAVVELRVMRDGKELTLKVNVPAYGADAKKFPAGKMRDSIVGKAAEYLAKQQQGDGGWECHLSGENGRVVMTSLCGMALIAAGNTAAKGDYRSNVKKAAEFVIANIGKESELGRMGGGGANWNQTNWGLGYGGMFLAEVLSASPLPQLKEKLTWVRDQILSNMEATGGFAHGPGGPNALNYLELEIVSNYCLAALGGAMANGLEVDKQKLDKALAYVQACGGGKGGVGYSTRQGQVGWGDPGRTGGAIMGFGACGRADHPYYKPMVGFLTGNLRDVIDGHVSPTMHHLSAASACWREGSKTWDAYWDAQRHEATMLRNPDCTFTARPTKESAQMGRNNDLDLGTVWNTAHWTIILCLEKDNLPVWFGKSGKKKEAKPEPEKKPDTKPVTGEKPPAKPPEKKPIEIDE
jgi:hypothetical protein